MNQWLESTQVIFTSDHGSQLFDRGVQNTKHTFLEGYSWVEEIENTKGNPHVARKKSIVPRQKQDSDDTSEDSEEDELNTDPSAVKYALQFGYNEMKIKE